MENKGFSRTDVKMNSPRNKNRKTHCDYGGTCKNNAFKEVYPMLMRGKHKNSGWSYLCRKHFLQEKKKYKNNFPYASVE